MAQNRNFACIQSIILAGSSAHLVIVESTISNNLPIIVIVGYATRAVEESKERIRGSFATSRIMLPRKRITVNLAPADLPKGDSGTDLAIAVSILAADGQLVHIPTAREAFIGELGLDGSLRPVRGIIGKLIAGQAKGVTQFYIAHGNLGQAKLVPGITLYVAESMREIYEHLGRIKLLPAFHTGDGAPLIAHATAAPSLSMIAGQEQAKRALEITAAGGHNLLLSGPPGSGKSLLAKALPGLLPPLSRSEVLEVTHLHSLSSYGFDGIVTRPPFRSPHHSASLAAITGGGNYIRPGEISLAHRGVLLFDEIPEFGRTTLEALRQPLEDGSISVARARETITLPANFILVGTANPCPCGYFGSKTACMCSAHAISRYTERLSGPVMDRIDLVCQAHEVDNRQLLTASADQSNEAAARARIQRARRAQARRFGSSSKLNADMTNTDIQQHIRLESDAQAALDRAARAFNLSARAYLRSLKVARSIADLEGSLSVNLEHVSEALQYRQ